ncbi:MAG: GNAT family N-acetyltransferase [Thermoleophilia bacterium]|nr:GNAT family N-acetyltransferase [Thermoleophilia bacterium]
MGSECAPVRLRPRFRAIALLHAPTRTPPFPLGLAAWRTLQRGQALPYAFRAAGLHAGDEVLVPSDCAGSLLRALAGAALVCRVYEADEQLEPDETRLRALLGPRTRALVIAHVLGFPLESARWRRWCDDHGLLLVEDCSEAWLSSTGGMPVGARADVAVFNLANTLPLPDASLAVVGERLLPEVPAGSGVLPPSWLALAGQLLVRPLALPAVGARRRAHYRALLAALDGKVAAPFDELPETASPFVFPLSTAQPRDAAARLAAAGVEARPFSSAVHPAVASVSGATGWRERAVALPVHQDLRPRDIERIVEAASAMPPATRRSRTRDLRLEPVTDLDALHGEWSELGVESGNLFATWEWQSTWWRHFGRADSLLAAACRDARGTLVGILPLYLAVRRPGRLVRFLGHGVGDRLGPICLPSDRLRVARALRAATSARCFGSALVLGEQLPAEESWSAILGARVVAVESSPVARIETASWDDFLATRSANVRQQVRRKERKLMREHDARYRLVEDPKDLAPALDALFALHRDRWGGENATRFARTEAFHRDFAATALARGWLRLWLLEVDGRPVAAWKGFRFAGVDWYYQMGRDRDWEHLSVGLVLLAHTIRDCVEAGLSEYRFLRGGEAYKRRFTNADPGLETIALTAGQIGQAGLVGLQAARRVRAARRARAAGTRRRAPAGHPS